MKRLMIGLPLVLVIGMVVYIDARQSQLAVRTTIAGCGSGIDVVSGTGSRVIHWFSEMPILRPSSGLPVRHAWLTLLNPTLRVQQVKLTAIEATMPAAERSLSVSVPARGRIAINLGDIFWPWLPRVDVGLEVVWETYGAATVALWDASYATQVIVMPTTGCYEAWPANPYGLER